MLLRICRMIWSHIPSRLVQEPFFRISGWQINLWKIKIFGDSLSVVFFFFKNKEIKLFHAYWNVNIVARDKDKDGLIVVEHIGPTVLIANPSTKCLALKVLLNVESQNEIFNSFDTFWLMKTSYVNIYIFPMIATNVWTHKI